ncbi:MAG: hypothetical protein VR69_03005 [Peptococcaceae bacterium BRH_c4b]|nr:MAG: hypothetical protein VR69_03005 [Peptococcaceae bacterium BRH_c4b]
MVKKMLNLRPHQKIFVLKEFDNAKYISTIEDFNNQTIYISLPLYQQVPLVLHRGNKIKVQLISPDHLLEFESTVTSLAQDNIVLIGISYPNHIKRVQLRKHVRLEILLKAQYAHEPEPGQEPVFKTVDAVNISAGGIRLATREHIEHGTKLQVKFKLPIMKKDIEFNLSSVVKRTALIELRGRNNLYHVGVEFLDITRRESDQIVQYIFQNSTKCGK